MEEEIKFCFTHKIKSKFSNKIFDIDIRPEALQLSDIGQMHALKGKGPGDQAIWFHGAFVTLLGVGKNGEVFFLVNESGFLLSVSEGEIPEETFWFLNMPAKKIEWYSKPTCDANVTNKTKKMLKSNL